MRRARGFLLRAVVASALAALLLLIGGMIYVVRAKYALGDYTMQTAMQFNAAMMVNAEETYTDEARAVIAEYAGARAVIAPENYRAVLSCLTRQAAMPLYARVDEETAMHICICGSTDAYIAPDADGEGFTVDWRSPEGRLVMHTAGGNHWERLMTLCMEGSQKAQNIPL